jgi:hypothetical protein
LAELSLSAHGAIVFENFGILCFWCRLNLTSQKSVSPPWLYMPPMLLALHLSPIPNQPWSGGIYATHAGTIAESESLIGPSRRHQADVRVRLPSLR